jgi:hypothetical protein
VLVRFTAGAARQLALLVLLPGWHMWVLYCLESRLLDWVAVVILPILHYTALCHACHQPDVLSVCHQ